MNYFIDTLKNFINEAKTTANSDISNKNTKNNFNTPIINFLKYNSLALSNTSFTNTFDALIICYDSSKSDKGEASFETTDLRRSMSGLKEYNHENIEKLSNDFLKFRISEITVPNIERNTCSFSVGSGTFNRPSNRLSIKSDSSFSIRLDEKLEIYNSLLKTSRTEFSKNIFSSNSFLDDHSKKLDLFILPSLKQVFVFEDIKLLGLQDSLNFSSSCENIVRKCSFIYKKQYILDADYYTMFSKDIENRRKEKFKKANEQAENIRNEDATKATENGIKDMMGPFFSPSFSSPTFTLGIPQIENKKVNNDTLDNFIKKFNNNEI